MIIVSACLMGDKCRYDGESKPCSKVISFVSGHEVLKVCPECLGLLPIPREPSEIVNGDGLGVVNGECKVRSRSFVDVSSHFLKGAEEVLNLCRKFEPSAIILKSKSPSCGCGMIYDGTFSGKLKKGDGVTTALLKKNGFLVITEQDLV
jgi:uncharacterized protein YbbK (DUF523 family)